MGQQGYDDFERKYVSANNRADAPAYDEVFITNLETSLKETAPELEDITNAVLAALAIGAHRADIVPRLFDRALGDTTDRPTARRIFDQFQSVLMVVWAFVGIPWCVPACMGLIGVLESRNLLFVAEGRACRDLDFVTNKQIGGSLMERTYANVQNDEVRQMLQKFFSEFSSLTWTVVFGYSLAGTTATGVFEEHQTQLVLFSAIASSGATRQAKSHLKAALGLGNSVNAVKAVYKAAVVLNAWNHVRLADIDGDQLAKEIQASQSASSGSARS